MRFRCWFFGCQPKLDDLTPPEYLECHRCGENICYGDIVGDNRYYRFKEFLKWWLFRKWIPEKCYSCGKRYRCDDIGHDIPF